MWCRGVWCGVVWCGMVWCGVVCGVMVCIKCVVYGFCGVWDCCFVVCDAVEFSVILHGRIFFEINFQRKIYL